VTSRCGPSFGRPAPRCTLAVWQGP
jgi:hypothetical protein